MTSKPGLALQLACIALVQALLLPVTMAVRCYDIAEALGRAVSPDDGPSRRNRAQFTTSWGVRLMWLMVGASALGLVYLVKLL